MTKQTKTMCFNVWTGLSIVYAMLVLAITALFNLDVGVTLALNITGAINAAGWLFASMYE
ncbi:hypothetical protein N0P70_005414 [Klebsiella michiganensis]|nr:hypothetical protein [Klebsiella michiganensis]